MCAGRQAAARARDQLTPFMFIYYVYIYYEWYQCKHAACRRLVWTVILEGAVRPSGGVEIRHRQGLRPAGAADGTGRGPPQIILTLFMRAFCHPRSLECQMTPLTHPTLHFTFLLSSVGVYFALLLFPLRDEYTALGSADQSHLFLFESTVP